jgi:hypothetical protein
MRLLLLPALALLLTSCGMNMYDQPKAKVLGTLPYDRAQSSMLELPLGTVSRNVGAVDPAFYSPQSPEGGFAADLPFPVTLEVLGRGQERYNIYCAPCHSYTGDGLGVIVQKGMPQPRSFHDPAVRAQPVGYVYNAITNGFGRMYPYASRIPTEDRWAITAYVRALQLSQFASPEDALSDAQVEDTLTDARPEGANP